MANHTVLIIGIEGFLGSRLAELFISQGDNVLGFDIAKREHPKKWDVITGNITDAQCIEDIFEKHQIHSIIHCGGISGPHVCNNDPVKVFDINFKGTLNLFEIARNRSFKGRIVFVSSSSVYGQAFEKSSCHTPVKESFPLLASEPYGCSKVACESLVRAYVKQGWGDILSLRVSIVYGPGRMTYCGITEMIKSALEGKPIRLHQGCDLPLPWVYIDDVCEAIKSALECPKEDIKEIDTLAYNVNGSTSPTFREMAQIIKKLIPSASIQETSDPDVYAMNARRMSIDSIQKDLGWKPQTSIEDGIKILLKSFQS